MEDLLNRSNHLLIENYFDFQIEAEKKYGQDTIVMLEVGSFMEVYEAEGIGKAKDVSNVLNILLTRKNKSIPEITKKNPSLCGIPNVSFEKHLERLVNENKYTIIIVKQDGTPPNITRKIERIISPGTNIDFLKNENYNFLASVYVEEFNKGILYGGLALMDISTGKSFVFENYGTTDDTKLVLDEIRQILSAYGCAEIILSGNVSENDLRIFDIPVHKKDDVSKSTNINYAESLLKQIYGTTGFLSAIEELNLERFPQAMNALVILLDFAIDHDMRVIKNLDKPILLNSEKKLYVGNNALKQLNVSDENGLIKYVNNGISAIGRRYINEMLFNPIQDKEILENRYFLSSLILSFNKKNQIKSYLKEIYDIERLFRKIELGSIHPFELSQFYFSLKTILSIWEELSDDIKDELIFDTDNINSMIKDIEDNFLIDYLSLFSNNNISKNFVSIEKNPEMIKMEKELNHLYLELLKPIENIEKLFGGKVDLTAFGKEYKGDNVFLSYTDTEGFYVELTNKKYESKKQEIDKIIQGKKKTLKGSVKFFLDEYEILSEKIVVVESKIVRKCKEVFNNFLNNFSEYKLSNIVTFVSSLEFYLNNAFLAEKYAYSAPIIEEYKESFIEAVGLRHPIVERISDEIYVPNNLFFGKRELFDQSLDLDVIFQEKDFVQGMLLYGLNSSGKSTLSKSLGISIILAQAGFFVPAKRFRFSLFESLFTRITGEDDIYSGKSTFAVEMLDLRNIFCRAGGKTLVIGDELSQGTETVSGLALVGSAINTLASRGVTFLFATHMHNLRQIKEVDNLNGVVDIHLSISYDEIEDNLIYDRVIASGSGSSLYGLEFAKSLKMDKEFLSTAFDIRRRLASDLDSIEALSRGKKSTYNAGVFLGACEVCGGQGYDVHHISEQQYADDKGMIGHFSKNHKGNLVCLCKECHDKVHYGNLIIKGWKQTLNGTILVWEEN